MVLPEVIEVVVGKAGGCIVECIVEVCYPLSLIPIVILINLRSASGSHDTTYENN